MLKKREKILCLPNVNLPSLTGEFILAKRSLDEVFLIPKLSKLVVDVMVK